MEKDFRNSETEKQLLRLLARQIEKQLNKGPVSEWSQRDFINLSETIENQTREQISVTTLKRVFGKVEYSGLPYIHTLNVLAQFIGHSHWSEFKKKELGIEELEETIELVRPNSGPPPILSAAQSLSKQKSAKGKMLSGLFILTGLIIFFVFGWYASWWWSKGRWQVIQNKNNIDSPGKISSEILYPDSIPVHVKFSYQGPQDDPNELTVISLEPGVMQHFSINSSGAGSKNYSFQKPGIYPIRIFCNRRQLAYYTFLIPSKSWQARAIKGQKISEVSLDKLESRYFGISNLSVKKAGIDTNSRFNSNLIKFKDFGLSGDSFTFSTWIRNKQTKPELKDELSKVSIRCANNAVQIQMAKLLPRNGFFIQISDNYLYNLSKPEQSGLVKDLDQWRKIKIQTRAKVCKVWIDDQLVLEKTYSLPLGDIYGLEYSFVGVGEVRDFQFHDQRGKIWEENFEKL